MEDKLDRLIVVAGRCSGPAWDRVKQLGEHPLFEQIIEALHDIDGSILEHDLDRVLFKLANPSQTATNSLRSTPN